MGSPAKPSRSAFADVQPAPAAQDLLQVVDLLRLDATRKLDPERQAEMGQFMTPLPIAKLMASFFTAKGRTLRLLDAGAGVGSLSAALVQRLCAAERPPDRISLSAYEIDPLLAGHLNLTLDACRSRCARAGVRFDGEVRQEDFVLAGVSSARASLFDAAEEYDCAILNPPYRKIHTDSRARTLLRQLGVETSNLYSAFLAIAVRLLKPGGQLVAITPRSFCNGPYFRPFRESFLEAMALRRIHCFEARDVAFSEDDVLQENVIIHAVKGAKAARVTVTASFGPEDEWPSEHIVDAAHVVKPKDGERVIHIPIDGLSELVTDRMEALPATLFALGLEVSTGRVVDFRAESFLRSERGSDTVPLLYPGHMVSGGVEWPRNGGKKPNALAVAPATESLLVPSGFYVLLKRFTSKEERRRIVAAVCDPARLPASRVAFENHLNYVHARGKPLTRDLAKGLAAFFNSTLVDCYFRDWSGHTQVNASDLRRLRYPTREQLEALGAEMPEALLDQEELDLRIERVLFQTMPSLKKSPSPVAAKRRVQQALAILKDLGLPREQQNERSALTLLALLDLKPDTPWPEASNPLWGIAQMLTFFARHYRKTYRTGSRETVRRYTVHQFLQAGLAIPNPDKPSRPTNSPQAVYQIEPTALALIRSYGTPSWEANVGQHLVSVGALAQRYARERELERIPLALAPGKTISLSPGGQNELVKKIVEEFCPRFTPGAKPIYVGDTGKKWAYFDEPALEALGVKVEAHGKIPDVVVHHKAKNWLVLIEAVTSHGPVSPKRRHELKELFASSTAGLVFVTAFLTRRDVARYLGDIAWETEVWVADAPTHLLHFNGERFLGPF
jgi:adenine-specific DNA-methyltransferase